jgi:alpha-glucosidase
MNTNIYGLGEVIAASGFRRAIEGSGSLTTTWARDVADPIDENEYGTHPVYLEHRFDSSAGSGSSRTHGVFLKSAAGEDVILQTPSGANTSLIQYRTVGGTLDLYFFSGPTSTDVIQQYGATVGLPTWMPMWSLGYHLCRDGFVSQKGL